MQTRTRQVDVFECLESLAQNVEWDWDDRPDQETIQKAVINSASTEHALGTKSSLEEVSPDTAIERKMKLCTQSTLQSFRYLNE
jgi:hypothetical protein